MTCVPRRRWFAALAFPIMLALPLAAAPGRPPQPMLGPTEALVATQSGDKSLIRVLDVASGKLKDVPGGPVEGSRPMVVPSRQSFFCWTNDDGKTAAATLWLVTLGSSVRRVYAAPAGYRLTATAWWQAHYCVLASFRVGDHGGRLVMVTPAGVSRETEPRLPPTVRDAWLSANTIAGLADGSHAVMAYGGGRARALVDVNTGSAVPFGVGWERAPGLGWPVGKADLYLDELHLNRADGRLYGTLYSGTWGSEEMTQAEIAALPKVLGSKSGVFSCKPDGSDLRRVNVADGRPADTERFPGLSALSPDGRQLLLAYHTYNDRWFVPGLWVCGHQGGPPRAVPADGKQLSAAAWGY